MRAFLRSNEWSCLRTQNVICLSDCSNSPPSVLAERRIVFTWSDCHRSAPCSGERKSRFGSIESTHNHDLSPRGSQDTRNILLQPSLAVCVCRRCPNRGVATGRYLPMRHRTNPDNFTKETDASMHCCYTVKVFVPQRFSDFIHFWISMETKWKLLNLPMGKLYLFLKGFLNYE